MMMMLNSIISLNAWDVAQANLVVFILERTLYIKSLERLFNNISYFGDHKLDKCKQLKKYVLFI